MQNETMFSSGEEATAIGRRRDRSYSDAHALLRSVSNNTEDQHHQHAPNITMDNKAAAEEHMIYKAASPLLVTKMSASKKSHHHHHHHGNNRPRSKSLDLHRHTSTPSKKKYPHHSPGTGAGHHHHGLVSAGRGSPGSSPKLKGKMWIRPEAAPSTRPTASIKVPPFFPMAPTPSHHQSTEELALQCKDSSKDDKKESSTKDQLKDGSSSTTTKRQVTDESSPSPTSFDKEMMTGEDLYQQSKASYEYERQYLQHHRPQGGHNHHGPTRIIFGESGKPIQPRSAFEQYCNPSTSPVL